MGKKSYPTDSLKANAQQELATLAEGLTPEEKITLGESIDCLYEAYDSHRDFRIAIESDDLEMALAITKRGVFVKNIQYSGPIPGEGQKGPACLGFDLFIRNHKDWLWQHKAAVLDVCGKNETFYHSVLEGLTSIEDINRLGTPTSLACRRVGNILTKAGPGALSGFNEFIKSLPSDVSFSVLPSSCYNLPLAQLEKIPAAMAHPSVAGAFLSSAVGKIDIPRLEELERAGVDLGGEYKFTHNGQEKACGLLELAVWMGPNDRRSMLLWMMQKGLPFETPHSDGALFVATHQGSKKTAKLLLSHGCPVSDASMLNAVKDSELCQILLAHGGNPNASIQGTNLLGLALYLGKVDVLPFLVPCTNAVDAQYCYRPLLGFLPELSDEVKQTYLELLKARPKVRQELYSEPVSLESALELS